MARPRLPDVLRISDEFRQALEYREAQAFQAMSEAYAQIERHLLSDFELLLRDVAEKGISPSRAVSTQRYKDLMRQLFEEQDRYAQFCTQIISNEQMAALRLGTQEAELLTGGALDPRLAELMTSWNRLPIEAIEAMVGFAADGSPLMPAMAARFGSAAPQVKQTLLQGVGLGWHPTKTARQLRGVLENDLLGNALTWARTEQIRASREASRRSYEANSHIVRGFRRHATLDDRTCAACLMLDGQFYPMVDGHIEPLADHPNGRCRMCPETISYEEILGLPRPPVDESHPWGGDVPTGQEWLQQKSPAEMRAWMESHVGKSSYDAWKAGKFQLGDIPKLNKNSAWGDSWTVKPLKDLLKGKKVSVTAEAVATPKVAVGADIRQRIIKMGDDTRQETERINAEIAELGQQGRELRDARRAAQQAGNYDLAESYRLQLEEIRRRDFELYDRRNKLAEETNAKARDALKVDNPAKTTLSRGRMKKERAERLERGHQFVNDIVGTGTVDGEVVEVETTREGRPYYSHTIYLNAASGEEDIAHEMGHWLEARDPEIRRKAVEFYERRTAGEEATWLGRGFAKDEIAKRDKFMDPYMGKVYTDDDGRIYSTEITSMGIGMLYTDPIRVATEDPDFFDFLIRTLRGL